MKFVEVDNVIDVPVYDKCFVYFLLKEDEVVYVGQTHKGLIRPLQHTDKIFDKIKIIYCDPKFLDLTEDIYIEKYKPIYNTFCNYKFDYTLHRIRNVIRKITKSKQFSISDLKSILKILNISPKQNNNSQTVSFNDYVTIINYIRNNIGGNYDI